MDLLFPQNPTLRKLPEPLFEPEVEAATARGFRCLLFDEDAVCAGEIDRALKVLPPGDGGELLYRGWILTEDKYRAFHEALSSRGYSLVSSPGQYATVTYFPNYYPTIRDISPAAVWTDTPDPYRAWTMARTLGDGPFVLKDHVKSAKHLWHEACFVPTGSGRENFERIAENLRREQGPSFFRGFVVKQFVPLRSRGDGPRQYPVCEEYRLFFWKGQLLTASHYHRLAENPVDWSPFVALARRFDAPFFSMDVAQTEIGDWIVVDMGAGECSALPPSLDAAKFYDRLAALAGSPGCKPQSATS